MYIMHFMPVCPSACLFAFSPKTICWDPVYTEIDKKKLYDIVTPLSLFNPKILKRIQKLKIGLNWECENKMVKLTTWRKI